jgi:hypothetical protein
MSSRLSACLIAFALLAPAVARSASADDAGFTPLFNGKDLTGWVTPDDKALFSVEDGQIVGRTQGNLKHNEFLATDRPYKNFHLKAKVKYKNGNSGIQVRSVRKPDGVVSGPQADIAEGYWGLLYEERGRGILERYPADKAKALVRDGDWNDMEVIFEGDHMIILLNGTKVIDRTDAEFSPDGIIALQVHVGPPMEVRFKDLMIRELK